MYTVRLTKVIIIFCLLKAHHSTDNFDSPIVKITSEQNITIIEGTKESNYDHGTYFAFRGISYAKPPVGNLRFKDPQQIDFLPNYIDARYDGHSCPSLNATNAAEDCLILNVYTKILRPASLLPVIVYIHGGGLYAGSSQSVGPQHVLAKLVVLVTFNYRLGTLGFLNLGTKDIPGNAGFKDQVHALRWIHKYIHHFGGNKEDVTLMGYSAGSQSVTLHLVSPMSKGLFHKAIIMSGVLPPQTILPRGQHIELAIRQSQKLNCTIENTATPEEILNCLNNFSGAEISATLREMFYFGGKHPIYLWRPIIERDFGQERFLTEDFYTLIERGEFQRVPLLIGFTNGEFCDEAKKIMTNENLKKELHEKFQTLAAYILMFEGHANESQLAEAISEYYTDTKNQKDWTSDQLCDMISDAIIRFGEHRLGRLAAKYVNVYAYNFVYKGTHKNRARVEHSEDCTYYLFPKPNVHQEQDDAMIKLYTDFIYGFAINGKINDSLTFPEAHISINDTLIQKTGSNFAAADFWEKLVP